MKGILPALFGDEEGIKALLSIGRSIAEKSDTVFDTSLSGMPPEQMDALCRKHGLVCEFVPFFSSNEELCSFQNLTGEQIDRVKKNLSDIRCLKLTAEKASFCNDARSSAKFNAEINRNGGNLSILLSGRLDSVSAPILLERYKKASEQEPVTAVDIDASKPEYLSLAGLRTLLIIQKALQTKLRFFGAPESVRDILEQTGFNKLFETD